MSSQKMPDHFSEEDERQHHRTNPSIDLEVIFLQNAKGRSSIEWLSVFPEILEREPFEKTREQPEREMAKSLLQV